MNKPESIINTINYEVELSSVSAFLSTKTKLLDNFNFIFQGMGFGESKITHGMLAKVLIEVKDLQKILNEYPNIKFKFDRGFYGDDWEKIKNTLAGMVLDRWYNAAKINFDKYCQWVEEKAIDEHIEFGNSVLIGAAAGLGLGAVYDNSGLIAQIFKYVGLDINDIHLHSDKFENISEYTGFSIPDGNGVMEGVVRLASGNGDTIGGVFQRVKNKFSGGKDNDQLDSFSLGQLAGMGVGPVIQIFSSISSNDNPVLYALYTSAYSNADNLGGGMAALISYMKEKGFKEGSRQFITNPFQATNLGVILVAYILNVLFLSNYGNMLDSQMKSALHGTILNVDSLLSVSAVRISNAIKISTLYKNVTNKNMLSDK